MIPTSKKDEYAGDSRDANLYRNVEKIKNTDNGMGVVPQGVIPLGRVLLTKITNDTWMSGSFPRQQTSSLIRKCYGFLSYSAIL